MLVLQLLPQLSLSPEEMLQLMQEPTYKRKKENTVFSVISSSLSPRSAKH